MKEHEEPRQGGAIKRRDKALHDTSWGKFVEREHDVKRKSFRFTDQKSNVTTDEYREGWDRIFSRPRPPQHGSHVCGELCKHPIRQIEPGDFDNGR